MSCFSLFQLDLLTDHCFSRGHSHDEVDTLTLVTPFDRSQPDATFQNSATVIDILAQPLFPSSSTSPLPSPPPFEHPPPSQSDPNTLELQELLAEFGTPIPLLPPGGTKDFDLVLAQALAQGIPLIVLGNPNILNSLESEEWKIKVDANGKMEIPLKWDDLREAPCVIQSLVGGKENLPKKDKFNIVIMHMVVKGEHIQIYVSSFH